MNHVRIHGDPFGDGPDQSRLRSFLRLATGRGMRCALSLSGVRPRRAGPGEREVPLTDGVRDWTTATRLPPAEVDLVLRAAGERVCSTAPLVVFAPDDELADATRLAGLEWSSAAAVVAGRAGMSAPELLSRATAELRWAGNDRPRGGVTERDVAAWLALPAAAAPATIVHVAPDGDLLASGADLAVDAFVALQGRDPGAPGRLRIVAPGASGAALAALRERAGASAVALHVVDEPFAPAHVVDAAAVLLPFRRFVEGRSLLLALASGRPVCASRFGDSAQLLAGRAVAHPIGGRHVPEHAEHGAHFAPHPDAVRAALDAALAERERPAGTAQRARAHVVAEHVRGRPSSPPAPLRPLGERRPSVVLEAPIFETSSSAELTIATAEELARRGEVDLRLVPSTPFQQGHDLGWLRRRAPALAPLLTRRPRRADLWLSTGWPVRAARPDCRRWALRVDWEYGALPHELTPHVTEDCDFVVVHSEHVYRTVLAAGRPMETVKVVPHGVDAAMHDTAAPSREVLEFKGARPAVLFCGGLVWRKGFDVFLSAVLSARAAGHDFVVVVKGIGGDQHYGNYHLGELLERLAATPGAPPVLRIERDLSRGELASVYTACDVMLHPYRGEGFGMPVLEARACGLPVVVTAGGATEGFLDGPGAHRIASARRPVELPGAHVANPWVLEPDPAAAAEALAAVLGDLPAQRRAAREVAPALRHAFSWQQAAASIEAFALDALRERVVPTAARDAVVEMPRSSARGPVQAHVPARS